MLTRLAHVIVRFRWPVIGLWLLLTLFGGFAAGQVSSRWFQSTVSPWPAGVRGESAIRASTQRRCPPAERRRFPHER